MDENSIDFEQVMGTSARPEPAGTLAERLAALAATRASHALVSVALLREAAGAVAEREEARAEASRLDDILEDAARANAYVQNLAARTDAKLRAQIEALLVRAVNAEAERDALRERCGALEAAARGYQDAAIAYISTLWEGRDAADKVRGAASDRLSEADSALHRALYAPAPAAAQPAQPAQPSASAPEAAPTGTRRERLARMLYEQINGKPWSLAHESVRDVYREALDHIAPCWEDVTPTPEAARNPWELSEAEKELVCSACGAKLADDDPMGRWRFNGESWEHKCPGVHPQAGHFAAESPARGGQEREASDAN